jgi:hypothetical protein
LSNIEQSILSELDARAVVKITLTLDIEVEAAGEFPADAERSRAITLGIRRLRSSALGGMRPPR